MRRQFSLLSSNDHAAWSTDRRRISSGYPSRHRRVNTGLSGRVGQLKSHRRFMVSTVGKSPVCRKPRAPSEAQLARILAHGAIARKKFGRPATTILSGGRMDDSQGRQNELYLQAAE